jgi:hypothetical protein
MSINIPDKLYKLLTLIGLILIGYGFYQTEIILQKYSSKIEQHLEIRDSLLLSEIILKNEKENLIHLSKILSKKFNVENPISNYDSTILFKQVLKGTKVDQIVSDSLNILWNDYLTSSFRLELISKKLEFSKERISKEALRKEPIDFYIDLVFFGLLLTTIGLLLWAIDTYSKNEKTLIRQEEKIYPYCQSCGKKFNSITNYGVNNDNTKNYAFCNLCLKKGKFTNPEITKEEFINNSIESVKNKNIIYKILLKRRLRMLDRWNENKY